jgi:hypothetical protein
VAAIYVYLKNYMCPTVLSVLSGCIFNNSVPHIVFYRIFTSWLKYVCWKGKSDSCGFVDKKVFNLGFSVCVTLKLKYYLLIKYTVKLEASCCKAYCFQKEC